MIESLFNDHQLAGDRSLAALWGQRAWNAIQCICFVIVFIKHASPSDIFRVFSWFVFFQSSELVGRAARLLQVDAGSFLHVIEVVLLGLK